MAIALCSWQMELYENFRSYFVFLLQEYAFYCPATVFCCYKRMECIDCIWWSVSLSSFFTYLFPRCLTCYNLFFTALPLMCRGIWDQDFHFEKIVRNQEGKFIIIPNTTIKQKIPLTYYRGQENQLFSIKLYAKWILEGVPFIFILLFYNLLDHCCIRLLLLLL